MNCIQTLKYAQKRFNRINYDIKQFCAKLALIAKRLQVPQKWLLAAIAIETSFTFDHTITNPQTKAYGLFQCLPSTCRHLTDLGILQYPEQIKYLDALQQLDIFEKYLKYRLKEQGFKRFYSFAHLYLAIFYPRAMKYYNKQDKIIGTRLTASLNPAFDLNNDGRITIGEIQQYYNKHFGSDLDSDFIIAVLVGIIKTFV